MPTGSATVGLFTRRAGPDFVYRGNWDLTILVSRKKHV